MKRVELLVTLVLFILVTSVVFYITVNYGDNYNGEYDTGEFWEGFIVEAHGMLLELLIFGILLTVLISLFAKRREIQELRNTIDFNREINTELSRHTIKASIRRLNELKVHEINLNQVNLCDLQLMKIDLTKSLLHAAQLRNTNLKSAIFSKIKSERLFLNGAKMQGIKLDGAILKRAEFLNVKANGIDFRKAVISKSNFIECELQSAKYLNATINDCKFERSNLKGSHFKGCLFINISSIVNCDFSSADFRGSINVPIIQIANGNNILRQAKFDKKDLDYLMSINPNIQI